MILQIRRNPILFVSILCIGTIIAIFAVVLWGRIGFDSGSGCQV